MRENICTRYLTSVLFLYFHFTTFRTVCQAFSHFFHQIFTKRTQNNEFENMERFPTTIVPRIEIFVKQIFKCSSFCPPSSSFCPPACIHLHFVHLDLHFVHLPRQSKSREMNPGKFLLINHHGIPDNHLPDNLSRTSTPCLRP